MKLSLASMVSLALLPACDCYDALDVIEGVEPPVDCVRFDPTHGNQCRSPHLHGTNTCERPLLLRDDTQSPTLVAAGATFDVELPSGEPRVAVHALSGATPFTVTIRREVR